MFYFKLVGAILVIGASVMLCGTISKKDTTRVEFLEDFYSFWEETRVQIIKYPIPMELFMQKRAQDSKKNLGKCLGRVCENIDALGVFRAWNMGFEETQKDNELNEEDMKILKSAGECLVADKAEALDSNMSLYCMKLKKYLQAIKEETQRKNGLNKKLFPLIALALVIILL